MAAFAVVECQAIVSRTIEPQQTAVLTVGSIQAGADNNAIPATALVKANIRWYDPAVRRQLLGPHHEVSVHIPDRRGRRSGGVCAGPPAGEDDEERLAQADPGLLAQHSAQGPLILSGRHPAW